MDHQVDPERPRTVRVTAPLYGGVVLISVAALMYEILLTRIFSVTLFYHFAFIAVSLAVSGISLGSLAVFVLLRRQRGTATEGMLCLASGGCSALMILAFLTHLCIPIQDLNSALSIYALVLTLLLMSLPFACFGACIAATLSRFPSKVGALYGADFLGAAAGCLLAVAALELSDGPTAVFVSAGLAAAAAVCFAFGGAPPRFKTASLILLLCTILLSFAQYRSLSKSVPLIRLAWIKGQPEKELVYEKWNSFSRIRVWGNDHLPEHPYGVALSRRMPPLKIRQLHVDIDGLASTVLTAFDGNPKSLGHLKWDMSNLPHYLKPNAEVLVIGSAGGRQVLSALAFGQRSVTGIEMNGSILEAATKRFAGFTGGVYSRPEVRLINDEARSFLARDRRTYDIIDITYIDTFAATSSGALVFTENALYTEQAWVGFLSHLRAGGILSCTRYYETVKPLEMYRLTALATAALKRRGVSDPRRHLWIARNVNQSGGVGTLLVAEQAFSDEQVAALAQLSRRMEFGQALTPHSALDPVFAEIANGAAIGPICARLGADVSAPSDDRPFFFHMTPFRSVIASLGTMPAAFSFNLKAVTALYLVLAGLVLLTLLCLVAPLSQRRLSIPHSGWLNLFFAMVGVGFMLVEVSQMQRLTMFLGHPTYGVMVALFSLLLSSGMGSWLSNAANNARSTRSLRRRLLALVLTLILCGIATPAITDALAGAATMWRIVAATSVLMTMGLLMGMMIPIGLAMIPVGNVRFTAWFWTVNAITSTAGSLLAIVIALNIGIRFAFWSGAACYALAALSALCFQRREREQVERNEAGAVAQAPILAL